jgi:hypothetical protein
MARESRAIESLQIPAIIDFVRHMSSMNSIWQRFVRKISFPTCLGAQVRKGELTYIKLAMTELRGKCETWTAPNSLLERVGLFNESKYDPVDAPVYRKAPGVRKIMSL